jgi:hypothetical protein
VKPSNEHSDSVFYGLAAEEIQAGKVDKGLMAKAIAKSKGDKKGAEVLYLEWRVDLLKEEAVLEFKRREADAKKREAEEREKREKADWDNEVEVLDDPWSGYLNAFVVFLLVFGVATIVILAVLAVTQAN